MKDDRTLERGEWRQRWFIYNGDVCARPETNEKAERFTKNMIEIESARFLDEYR